MNNLNDFTKEQLVGLLQKANKRRKRESREWKEEARFYTRQFIAERDAQARTCANFRKYMDEVEARELELRRRENEAKQWRDNVDELVNKEAQGYKDLYAVQECSRCEEKRWRNKYRQTYSGMSEFCGKYINIVDDMMRQKNLPDNVKVRLCDMRIAFVESREFLDKVMKENMLTEDVTRICWNDMTEKEKSDFLFMLSHQKSAAKPASEELEQEISMFCNQILNGENEAYTKSFVSSQIDYIAHHFVNWQKQQIMKDAVEGKIVSVSTRLGQLFKAESELMTDNKFKWGDKVKIVILKD